MNLPAMRQALTHETEPSDGLGYRIYERVQDKMREKSMYPFPFGVDPWAYAAHTMTITFGAQKVFTVPKEVLELIADATLEIASEEQKKDSRRGKRSR